VKSHVKEFLILCAVRCDIHAGMVFSCFGCGCADGSVRLVDRSSESQHRSAYCLVVLAVIL